MTQEYVYDPEFAAERDRLAGIESLWDAGSTALLEELGVAAGWSCLEVGAGGGSLVRWLSSRVGAGGHVLATDLDTRFIDDLGSEVVEVRRHDLRSDPLPGATFDLVHTRLLLEHLPERTSIVRRLAEALRPGGVLVVEDYDWTGFGIVSGTEDLGHVADAVIDLMVASGYDPRYGRQVTGDLAGAGLVDVRGEGRARVIDGAHPGFAFFRLSFESLAPGLVATGRMTGAEVELARSRLAGPDARVLTPLMVAAIGRRPG